MEYFDFDPFLAGPSLRPTVEDIEEPRELPPGGSLPVNSLHLMEPVAPPLVDNVATGPSWPSPSLEIPGLGTSDDNHALPDAHGKYFE